MGQSKISDAMKLARIRSDLLLYCESIPDIIETHGANSLGSVALAIGKCFSWIGPTIDEYNLAQNLPGAMPLPTVHGLGERLRVIGFRILHTVPQGELEHTIQTLTRQIELLHELTMLQSQGKGGEK
jgi:hypothetical protein